MIRKSMLPLLTAGLLLHGCATTPGHENAQKGAAIGALGGAVAGAIIGNQSGNPRTGAAIGAVLGAGIGGAVGAHLDEQERMLERSLAEERARNEVIVERTPVQIVPAVQSGSTQRQEPQQREALRVTFREKAFFRFDSAEILNEGQRTLDSVAQVLREYPETRLVLTGYTDSVGSDSYNQSLSLRRAQAVAEGLARRGIRWERMEVHGSGEASPIASNSTEAGRQLNRRVELLIIPQQQG